MARMITSAIKYQYQYFRKWRFTRVNSVGLASPSTCLASGFSPSLVGDGDVAFSVAPVSLFSAPFSSSLGSVLDSRILPLSCAIAESSFSGSNGSAWAMSPSLLPSAWTGGDGARPFVSISDSNGFWFWLSALMAIALLTGISHTMLNRTTAKSRALSSGQQRQWEPGVRNN